jgi:hypothetical protein
MRLKSPAHPIRAVRRVAHSARVIRGALPGSCTRAARCCGLDCRILSVGHAQARAPWPRNGCTALKTVFSADVRGRSGLPIQGLLTRSAKKPPADGAEDRSYVLLKLVRRARVGSPVLSGAEEKSWPRWQLRYSGIAVCRQPASALLPHFVSQAANFIGDLRRPSRGRGRQ